KGDSGAVAGLIDDLVNEGKDPRQLLRDVTGFFRSLMLTAAGGAVPGDRDDADRTADLSRRFGLPRLISAIEVLARTEGEARWSERPRLLLEVVLLGLAQAPSPRAEVLPATAPPSSRATAPAASPPRLEAPRPVRAPARAPEPDEPPMPEPPPDSDP